MSSNHRVDTIRAVLVTAAPWFISMFVALLIVTTVIALYAERNQRALLSFHAEEAVRAAASIVEHELDLVRADARFLADDPGVRAILTQADARGQETLFNNWSTFLRHRSMYDRVVLLDEAGAQLAQIDQLGNRVRQAVGVGAGAGDLTSSSDRDAAERLSNDEVFLSRIDIEVERRIAGTPWIPSLRVVFPLRAADGRLQAVLTLNHLVDPLVAQLDALALQAPGDLLVVDSEGFYLVGVPVNRRWGFVYGQRSNSLGADDPLLWAALRTGNNKAGSPHLAVHANSTPDIRGLDLYIVCRLPAAGRPPLASILLRTLPITVPTTLLLLTLTLGLAWTRRQSEGHRRQTEESERRLRQLSVGLFQAQESERRAIARDLHDEIGQLGTAATLQLQRAARTEDPTIRKKAIDDARAATDELLIAIRRIAERHHPEVLDELGLLEGVRHLVTSFERTNAPAIELNMAMAPKDCPSGPVADHAFRILQAALANVARHADAKLVQVDVHCDVDWLIVGVRDDGRGFDARTKGEGRLGLLGMRERAELLGGTFVLTTAPGAGTEVLVRLPLGTAVSKQHTGLELPDFDHGGHES